MQETKSSSSPLGQSILLSQRYSSLIQKNSPLALGEGQAIKSADELSPHSTKRNSELYVKYNLKNYTLAFTVQGKLKICMSN